MSFHEREIFEYSLCLQVRVLGLVMRHRVPYRLGKRVIGTKNVLVYISLSVHMHNHRVRLNNQTCNKHEKIQIQNNKPSMTLPQPPSHVFWKSIYGLTADIGGTIDQQYSPMFSSSQSCCESRGQSLELALTALAN
jgi:hypothetical protein